MCGDREKVLASVRIDGTSLGRVGAAPRHDRDIVLAAVRQDGQALHFACEALRKDRDIVLEAIRQDVRAMYFAHDSLRQDRDLVLEALRQDGRALTFAHRLLRNDRDIVLEAVRQDGRALQSAGAALQQELEVVLEAVRQNGKALEFVRKDLREDPLIIAAKENCIAGQGAQAPVAFVVSASQRPDACIEVFVTFGLSGQGSSLVFGPSQTLGDLAAAVVRAFNVESRLVHVCMANHERPGPLDVNVPMVSCLPLAGSGHVVGDATGAVGTDSTTQQ